MENINTPTPALNYGGEQVWLKTTPPWWWAPPKLVFLRPKRHGHACLCSPGFDHENVAKNGQPVEVLLLLTLGQRGPAGPGSIGGRLETPLHASPCTPPHPGVKSPND